MAPEIQQYWPLVAAFVAGYVLSQKGFKIPLLSQDGQPAGPAVVYATAPAPSPVKVQLDTPQHAVTVDGGNINVTKKE